MAKDKFFEQRRGKKQERKAGQKEPKPNTFLIVSEGEKTEPFYFDGLRDYINNQYNSNSIYSEKPVIQTRGEGRSTKKLVEEANYLVARSKVLYSQVWLVFDRDDNVDFDEAIELAKKMEYHVAWNNRSFEYWIFLHYNFSDAALDQAGWTGKISEIFKQKRIDPNGYKKSDPKVFRIVTADGGLKRAVKNAIKREEQCGKALPSQCDPCTTVHHLILQLAPYLKDLLE